MFNGATSFDQNLQSWDVSSLTYAQNFVSSSHVFSLYNYNRILIGWAPQNVNTVSIDFGSSQYSAGPAYFARATLISKGWTITDGGQV